MAEAQTDLEAALLVAPEDTEIQQRLAQLLLRGGHIDRARVLLAGRRPEALKELGRAAALAGDIPGLWKRIAQLYRDAGDTNAAAEAETRAARSSPPPFRLQNPLDPLPTRRRSMISRTRSLLTATSSALAILAAAPASAVTELDLQGVVGYDSNVFNLNDSIGERDGRFTDLEAGFIAERDWLGGTAGFDLGLAARLFESSVNDGDETKYFVRLRGDSGGKRKDRAFEWALRYRVQDSTYVSRSTGIVATDGLGSEMGDRFDSSIGDLRGAWNLPGGAFIKGVIETKDYRKDYAALGLDRLDYTQYEVTPGYEAGNRIDTFRLRLPLALRQYRDREASNVDGTSATGTDLEYRYYGLDARYEHEFSRASALQLSGGYEVRQDNYNGHSDRQRWNVEAEWNHRPDTQSRLSAGLEWSSRVLDRPVTGAPVNDEAPEKKGYTLNVKYARPFPGVEIKNLSLLAEGRWESFDNSNNVIFCYDRLEVFAGIRKKF